MKFEFKLPDLGEGITEGEIVKWLVKEGDAIEEHQIILELETDKAIVEVPSPKKGTVTTLGKARGEIVPVGTTLLTIEVEGEEEAVTPEKSASVSVVGRLPEGSGDAYAVPKARVLARETGVDLASIDGTGPGGIITEDDVRSARTHAGKSAAEADELETGKDRYGPIERVRIKGVRRSIAKNLTASQQSAAFVTGMEDADVTELASIRARERKAALEKGIHLTFLPFFIKAVTHALAFHPMLNGSVDKDAEEITVKKYYNIGVAVDTEDGLMVSVIKAAGGKTIIELAEELADLSERARQRKITLDELKGSTFTISNYGAFGGMYATPIINPPEIAILGTGRISERPWVKDNKIVIRKILPLSLTFDHRVIDGGEAARFLNRVVGYLEDPASLFIESA